VVQPSRQIHARLVCCFTSGPSGNLGEPLALFVRYSSIVKRRAWASDKSRGKTIGAGAGSAPHRAQAARAGRVRKAWAHEGRTYSPSSGKGRSPRRSRRSIAGEKYPSAARSGAASIATVLRSPGAARPAPGAPLAGGRRCASDRCLRQGMQGATVRQLPRMRQRPIEACCKADGLRFVLDVT
jgi:hypothetical protein